MKKIKNTNKIKSYYKNRLLFIKYLRDNPDTDIPIPDDIVIPDDLIYDEYTIPWIGILHYSPRIDANDKVIAYKYLQTPTTTTLDNGETEYSLTITLNANTVKTRSSFVVANAGATNMNKVFGTYKVELV